MIASTWSVQRTKLLKGMCGFLSSNMARRFSPSENQGAGFTEYSWMGLILVQAHSGWT